MAWTTPKTWIGDELLTASDLNQYVSDNLAALYALVLGSGRKNLLINGAMRVAQRGTSVAGLTASAEPQTCDRWKVWLDGLGTHTVSREADAPTGSGFTNSLKVLATTGDASPAASDYLYVDQRIEGQDLQDIRKGATDAQQVTLSFWTKSNATGTYVVTLLDADNSRQVSATYTVAVSGTWEQQTITFPADLTGAFDNDSSYSLQVRFWLGAGSDCTSGTLRTTWAAQTTADFAVGQTNMAATTSNYWQVTGCQLEVGSAATGFEYKTFAQELLECERYFQSSYPAGSAPGSVTSVGALTCTKGLTATANRWFVLDATFRTRMRVTPTVAVYATDGTAGEINLYNNGATQITVTNILGKSATKVALYLLTDADDTEPYVFQYTASAE